MGRIAAAAAGVTLADRQAETPLPLRDARAQEARSGCQFREREGFAVGGFELDEQHSGGGLPRSVVDATADASTDLVSQGFMNLEDNGHRLQHVRCSDATHAVYTKCQETESVLKMAARRTHHRRNCTECARCRLGEYAQSSTIIA